MKQLFSQYNEVMGASNETRRAFLLKN
uniref:Uncharacterized protein n=1 Tax=Arundo donax TaxID=35708 RepID=A0A0A9A2A8_ARUDO